MKLKATKLQKLICAFMCLGLSSLFTVIVASAGTPYDNCPIKVVEAIEVANGIKDLVRRLAWAILVALANLVDYIDQGVTYLMGSGAYNLVKKAFPEIETHHLAVSILALGVVFAGVILMFNVDKLKISDTLRNILVAACIIVGLPVLTSELVNLKNSGVADAKSIKYSSNTSKDSIYHFLGETILAKHTMDVEQSVTNKGEVTFDETAAFNSSKSIYSLRYSSTIDNSAFHLKVVDYDMLEVKQIAFQDLTEEDMVSLLGLTNEYKIWNNPTAIGPQGQKLVTYQVFGIMNQHQILIRIDPTSGSPLYYDRNTIDPETGDFMRIEPEGYTIDKGLYFKSQILGLPGYYIPGIGAPNSNGIIPQLERHNDVTISLSDYNNLQNSSNLQDALKYIRKNLIFELNCDYNENEALTTPDIIGKVNTAELVDEYTFANMGIQEKIEQRLSNWGTGVEKLYKYHVDFWQCLIMLILVGISLIFASIKLAGMLYDMMFMNIIVPIVAATDATGNGRAKKAVTELVVTYVLFIVVVFILNIYITTVDVIVSSNINLVAKYALILAGAKFVIDGPDIIVKLTGSDAGVKSGYGALMGVRAAASTARGAAHTVSGAAHTAAAAPGKLAHGAAKVGGGAAHVAGGVAGGISGTASAAAGAFNASRDAGGGVLRSAANAAASMPAGAIGGTIGGAFGHGGNPVSRGSEAGGHIGQTLGSAVSGLGRGNNAPSASPTANAAAAGAIAGGVVGTAAGAKGEKGDTGPMGPKGEQGEQGAEGQRGEQGERGDVAQEATQAAQAQVNGGEGISYGNAFGDTSPSGASTASPDGGSTSAPSSAAPASSPVSSAPSSNPAPSTPSSTPAPTFAESERRNESATPTFTEQQRAAERPKSNSDK